jgi:hypothetical protein
MTIHEPTQELTKEEKASREALKLQFEVYKHITTLSSGSVLIICTFLEKFFKSPKWIPLMMLSLGFFFLSIILSIYAMNDLARKQNVKLSDRGLSPTASQRLEGASSFTFIIAVLLLIGFSLFNFYKG